MFNKKNPPISSMANAVSLVVPASAKKEPSVPNTFFKSSSKKQEKSKGSFMKDTISGLTIQSNQKNNIRNSGGVSKLGSDRRMDLGFRNEISPLKSV